jgi:hypothetical protein
MSTIEKPIIVIDGLNFFLRHHTYLVGECCNAKKDYPNHKRTA